MTNANKPASPSLLHLFLRMGGWFVAMLALFFIGTAISSLSKYRLAVQFADAGIEIVAQIIDKKEVATEQRNGTTKVSHQLTLSYTTRSGHRRSISRPVPPDVYDAAKLDGPMTIWYLESEPLEIEIQPGEHQRIAKMSQTLSLISGSAMLGGLWIVGRNTVSAIRARRYGRRETAVVTGVRKSFFRPQKQYRYRLTWRELSGREGQSLPNRVDVLDAFPAGSQIYVYQGSNRAWWAFDLGERPEDGQA